MRSLRPTLLTLSLTLGLVTAAACTGDPALGTTHDDYSQVGGACDPSSTPDAAIWCWLLDDYGSLRAWFSAVHDDYNGYGPHINYHLQNAAGDVSNWHIQADGETIEMVDSVSQESYDIGTTFDNEWTLASNFLSNVGEDGAWEGYSELAGDLESLLEALASL